MDMNSTKKHYYHMTLFWGKNSEILFDGWPGTRGGMYALALVTVFAFAFLVEWLNNSRLIGPRWNRGIAELTRTLMHTIRVGLYFLIMLALMSFNVGVVLVAVAGHVVAFFLFGSSVFKHEAEGKTYATTPMAS
ncbi:copper transporter 1-like [Typha angustifolia]|uniref:copper transporter 1-like n=1 Tax=Typha angustifolia TaxID=59011 RepID=UPI003C2B999F